jgi:hypothetical protein
LMPARAAHRCTWLRIPLTFLVTRDGQFVSVRDLCHDGNGG